MIQDVIMKDVDLISDDRGYSSNVIEKKEADFGELQVQSVYPGVVKGWYQQCEMDTSYFVPKGMIKLVVYDERDDSSSKGEFQEVFIGDRNPILTVVPKGVWVGYKCISLEEALVIVVKNSTSKKAKVKKLDPDVSYIKYNWGCKNK